MIDTDKFAKCTICIEIPAYKDFELMNTVRGAIKQASHPERVHFAICYQDDDMETLEALQNVPNCKVTHIKPEDARGTGYARHQCQLLLDDSDDFIFQMDAHMRFVKNWDSILLTQWHSLGDEKGIISSWIPDYVDVDCAIDDPKFDKPAILNGYMCVAGFFPNSSLLSTSFYCNGTNDGTISEEQSMIPKKHPLVVANYVFASAMLHKTILYDPAMFFYGDEASTALRYWTHGYNMYSFPAVCAYHRVDLSGKRNRVQSRPIDNNGMTMGRLERVKIDALIGKVDKNLAGYVQDDYGLGDVRTMQEYEKFAGVDFHKQIVYKKAQMGDFESDKLELTYVESVRIKYHEELYASHKVDVFMFDCAGMYEPVIRQCKNAASCNVDLTFFVAKLSDHNEDPVFNEELNAYIFEFDRNMAFGTMLLQMFRNGLGEYVMITHSNSVYARDWDECCIRPLILAGRKSVVTSDRFESKQSVDVLLRNIHGVTRSRIPYAKYINKMNAVLSIDYKDVPIIDGKASCNLNGVACNVLSEYLLFARRETLNKLGILCLDFQEFVTAYSMKLWMAGYTIYVPNYGPLYKLPNYPDVSHLSTKDHSDLVTAIMCNNNQNSRVIMTDNPDVQIMDYERPCWTFYQQAGIAFNPHTYRFM